MYKIRKVFSKYQKEFANKENKRLKRQYYLLKGYKISDNYVSSPSMERKYFQGAHYTGKPLPSMGPGYDKLSKIDAKVADMQEDLLGFGRRDKYKPFQKRGVKKVRGVKETANPIDNKYIQEKKKELIGRAKQKGTYKKVLKNLEEKNKTINSTKPNVSSTSKVKSGNEAVIEEKVKERAKETANKTKKTIEKLSEESANNKAASKEVTNAVSNPNKTAAKDGLVKRATAWMRKNPGKSIAGGLAALGTGGLLGYQHYKNKKKNNN